MGTAEEETYQQRDQYVQRPELRDKEYKLLRKLKEIQNNWHKELVLGVNCTK